MDDARVLLEIAGSAEVAEPRPKSLHLPIKRYHLAIIGVLCDLVALTAACAFSAFVFLPVGFEGIKLAEYAFAAVFTIALSISISSWFGLYAANRDLRLQKQLRYILAGFSASILLLVLALFLFKSSTEYSRGWLIGWWLFGTAGVISGRLILDRFKARWVQQGKLRKNVAIVGATAHGLRAIDALPKADYQIVGVFDNRRTRNPDQIKVIGSATDLLRMFKVMRVDQIIVALPRSAQSRICEIVSLLHPLPADVSVCFDDEPSLDYKRSRRVGGLTLLDIHDRPLSEWRDMAKAIEDRLLGALILAAVSPVLLLAAIAIKIDSPGPVFFRQKRYGWRNELIEVYKFRTMFANEADLLGEQLTRRSDIRITRVGRFLRRTSLDELPQFINVIRGEMSIVGPRPHAVKAKAADKLYHEAVVNYALRHRVKPGITGWAQINGWRGETDTIGKIQQRVEHDLYYIENWSLFFDLEIIVGTVLQIFRKNAAF